ncbi:lipid A-modifier LpxR family protein [Sphingobacterium sp.]|uniref:lipid A-modifier LpxR family protein n=1 Tax=Sphingobacterium sp. TaxID=341027 RepID=UPI0031D10394
MIANKFYTTVFCLLISFCSYCQEEAANKEQNKRKSFRLYLDEDINPLQLFPSATDQNYTLGLGFGFSNSNYINSPVFYPIRKLDQWILGKSNTAHDDIVPIDPSWMVNGVAFTPDNLRAKDPVYNDRPYAFLLGLSTRRGYVNANKGTAFHTELNIGALGLPIGKWVQTGIHKVMNDHNTHSPYNPEGWHNQIANGFSPVFLYSADLEKLIIGNANIEHGERSYFNLKVGGGSSVGYYTQVHGMATVRFGFLDSRKWVQNFNPLGNMNQIYGSPKKELWEIYLFAAARPTFMAYNAMLHGTPLRSSVHELSWKQTNPWILEWNTGIQCHIPFNNSRSMDITWAINSGRTSELKTDLKRTHFWGGVYLVYNCF